MCELCELVSAGRTGGGIRDGPGHGLGVGQRHLPRDAMPEGIGRPRRRTLIRGGSMDPGIRVFPTGDALIEGSRIVEVAARIEAPGAAVIDAAGMIVMPGFIDTHHHQFETALRSFLGGAGEEMAGGACSASTSRSCGASSRRAAVFAAERDLFRA
jgi:hypothetical protein